MAKKKKNLGNLFYDLMMVWRASHRFAEKNEEDCNRHHHNDHMHICIRTGAQPTDA